MAGVARLLVIVVLFSALLPVSQGAAGSALSANGRYAVELSWTPEAKMLVSVFQVEREQKVLSWSRAIEWQTERRAPGLKVFDVRPLISGDGEKVVLREYYGGTTTNGVKIVGRKETDTHQAHPFRNSELIGLEDSVKFRPDTTYRGVPCVLDFILEEERIYAAWFAQTDRWLTLSMESYEFAVVKDEETVAKLNAHAHEWAEQLVLEHQPPPLRRAVDAVRKQVAKLVPSLGSQSRQTFFSGDTVTAYLFLAARRIPSERRYIEGLVNFPLGGVYQADVTVGQPVQAWYWPYERLMGDWLLSRWNGEPNRDVRQQRETFMLFPMNYLYSLGSLLVKPDLGMPLPKQPGTFWAYLIPESIAQWTNSPEVIALKVDLPPNRAEEDYKAGASSSVRFQSLTPGTYRLKLVWERHPPAGVWRTNIYVAQPGDYESAESQPVTVVKGQVATVTLACTNRVGGADAYKEDDEWSRSSSK